MPRAPRLRELQHELETLLSLGGDPDCEQRLGRAAPSLPIRSDHRLDGAARLAIYAEMIFIRIRDAVTEDFPATRAAIESTTGSDAWEPLLRAYLRVHPTSDPDLRRAGRDLPAYLRAACTGPAAWIGDVAELEWALVRAFEAADAVPLAVADLEALPPEDWPALRLRAVPSLLLLEHAVPADTIHRRLVDGEPLPDPNEAGCRLRVWRQGFTVYQRRIEPIEQAALARVLHGTDFASLCEWLAERVPEGEASQTALRLLQSWLADELLAAEVREA